MEFIRDRIIDFFFLIEGCGDLHAYDSQGGIWVLLNLERGLRWYRFGDEVANVQWAKRVCRVRRKLKK